ncbi:hypothetical protein KIPB_017209, partial [Kipferlia bialata]
VFAAGAACLALYHQMGVGMTDKNTQTRVMLIVAVLGHLFRVFHYLSLSLSLPSIQ